ncbi:MAG: hypothetical protein ACOH18_01415 [Candidatus Saccharimonadaceae bacterium]
MSIKPRISEQKSTFFRFLGLYIASILAIAFAMMTSAQGLPYGKGAYGKCQFSSCSITLTSSTSLAANVTPGGSTTCTVANDDVTVRTGSSTGYTLTVSDSDTTTSLDRSGGGSITTVSGTPASPTTLSANKWGYRVDGLAGFGAGPTSAVSNAAVPSEGYAAMPILGSPDTLKIKTSAATVAETTKVWYGICSNTSIPAGSYTNTVVYTAIIN